LRYLDANVFTHAVLHRGPKGAKAADLLRSVAEGEEDACTSALAWDEVVGALMAAGPREKALSSASVLFSSGRLRLVPIRREEIQAATKLMEEHAGLDPRDAIHAACAMAAGAKEIVSEDADFDGVVGLRRVGL
jgi:predicted nucleic acid-binding protein